MSSRMEQIIEEIEEYIDSCKFQPLSSTKILVNKEELEELLTELRMKTPEEIKRYQKIISNKEAILADAQAKADVQTTELVNEHQIMQQAYAQANEVVMIATKQAQEILDKATSDANDIRMGAIGYTDELLKNTEEILSHAIDSSHARYDNLINSLQDCMNVVTANRAELMPQEIEEAEEDKPASEAQEKTESGEANLNTDMLS